jgi:hypothetical protein
MHGNTGVEKLVNREKHPPTRPKEYHQVYAAPETPF